MALDYPKVVSEQKKICKKMEETKWFECPPSQNVSVSKDIGRHDMLDGVRRKPENNTCGWYIWTGGGTQPNDFTTISVEQLYLMYPYLAKYLGLPPGWKYQINVEGYEDLRYDEELLTD